MSSQLLKQWKFSCESDASLSYLIIDIGKKAYILEYQVEMIGNNPSQAILPVVIRRENDRIKLCYNVTSKQPLSQFVKREKLNRDEAVSILRNITRSLLECKNYFLSDKYFLLDKKFLYINPATLVVSLAYIPLAPDTGFNMDARCFLRTLAADLLGLNERDSDHFLRRIQDYLDAETFSLMELDKLLGLTESSYKNLRDRGERSRGKSLGIWDRIPGTTRISIPQSAEHNISNPDISRRRNIILAAVLLQVLILIVIFIIYQTVLSKKEMDISSIFGLFLIAGAADYFFLRNFLGIRKTTE